MNTLIGGTNKDSQTSNRATATDAFKLISGIRRHIEDDRCCCCKAALLDTVSVEISVAGSTGDQATEPARNVADTSRMKYLHDIQQD